MGNIFGLSVLPAVTASDRINQNTDEASYKQVQRYKVDKQETWVVIHIHNMHTEMQSTVWVKAETNKIYTFRKNLQNCLSLGRISFKRNSFVLFIGKWDVPFSLCTFNGGLYTFCSIASLDGLNVLL